MSKERRQRSKLGPKRPNQYFFLKYQMELNDSKGDLFKGDEPGVDTLNVTSIVYPTFWHEYTHYIQNVATSIGVRIFLNWIAVLVCFSENAHRLPTLKVPMRLAKNEYDFDNCFNGFILEHNRLIGLETPLDKAPPSEAEPFTTYVDPKDGTHAYLCMEEDGHKVGVPLYGSIFSESMAQAVQWLVEGKGLWSETFLAGKSILGRNAFYYALFRYFLHFAPNINPCIPVLYISEMALQTLQPALWFCYCEKHAFKHATDEKWWHIFGSNAHNCELIKKGVTDTIGLIRMFEEENAAKKETQFMQLALSMTSRMRELLTARLIGRSLLPELLNPTTEEFNALIAKCNCPVIYTANIDNALMFGETEKMNKWCSLNLAFYDLAYGLNANGLTTACPLLHTRMCSLLKDQKTYCHEKRLTFPSSTGSGCPMECAAQLLSVRNKPTVTIR